MMDSCNVRERPFDFMEGGAGRLLWSWNVFSSRAGAWLFVFARYGPVFFSARIMHIKQTKSLLYMG